MTNHELLRKARTFGTDRLHEMLGGAFDRAEISRWLSGGINASLEVAARAKLA